MTTYQWKIEALETKPVDGDYTNVVVTAHWRCTGNNDIHTADVYGACSFTPPSDPFTPYEELTKEQVLEWCWNSGVIKESMEMNVGDQIENLTNPPVVKLPLPWEN